MPSNPTKFPYEKERAINFHNIFRTSFLNDNFKINCLVYLINLRALINIKNIKESYIIFRYINYYVAVVIETQINLSFIITN